MKEGDTKNSLLESWDIMLCVFVSVVLGVVAVYGMPLFSDSAFHATIIRDVIVSGYFPVLSPVGWAAIDMNPTSYQPFLTHPSSFYLLASSLAVVGISIKSSLTLINILPTALSIPYMFLLMRNIFSREIAILSAFLLTTVPMSIWLNSHRIMEPYQYLMSLAAVYYSYQYIQKKNKSYIILAAIFCSSILYIKITSLFIVVSIFIWFILTRVDFKHLIIFCLTVGILYMPYAVFSIQTRGTVSYSPPGLPIIDHYILKPWWDWPKSKQELQLNNMSDFNTRLEGLVSYNETRIQYIQDQALHHNFAGVVQDYSVFPVSNSASIHWFSPALTSSSVWLFFFAFGIYLYLKKYRLTKYHYLFIPLALLITAYLTKVGELRYFFILNILLIPFTAIAIYFIANRYFTSQFGKILLYTLLALTLVFIDGAELIHSRAYASSLIHDLVQPGTGIPELQDLSHNIAVSGNIFTPATSETAYYLNARTIWDWRLFFIPGKDINAYLDRYNVRYLLIPRRYLQTSILDLQGDSTLNTKNNWVNSSIPTDSDFYAYLNQPSEVKIVAKYQAFIVYERIEK